MASPLLIDYMNRCRAIYHLHRHAPAGRSAELAQALSVPLRWLVKPVMVTIDGTLAMAVMPADIRLSFESLRRALGAKQVELAPERSFMRCFPRCEPGAIPPVGHLFGLNAYALPLFDTGRSVYFCAGSCDESVEMPFAEFRRLAHFDEISYGNQLQSPSVRSPRRVPLRSRDMLSRPMAMPAIGAGAVALQGW